MFRYPCAFKSSARLFDGRKLEDLKLPFLLKHVEKKGIEKSKGAIIFEMLKEAGLI